MATLGASLVASRPRGDRACSRPSSRNAPTSSACRQPRSTTAASRRRRRRSRRGSSAIWSAASPASARTSTTSPFAPETRDLRSFGSQGEQRLAVLSLLLAEAEVIAEQRSTPPLVLLDDVLSELDAARRRALAERIGRVGQAIVTATSADALPLEPAQLLAGDPRRRERALMDRLDRQVRRELGRFGPMDGDMTAIVRVWPAAVGETVARNACPARLARDGTLHVNTASATWAFELGSLAPTILEQLRHELGEAAPPALRFAPGPIPEPARRGPRAGCLGAARDRSGRPCRGGSARSYDRRRGASRTGRSSRRRGLAAGPLRPHFLIHYSEPARCSFAGLF